MFPLPSSYIYSSRSLLTQNDPKIVQCFQQIVCTTKYFAFIVANFFNYFYTSAKLLQEGDNSNPIGLQSLFFWILYLGGSHYPLMGCMDAPPPTIGSLLLLSMSMKRISPELWSTQRPQAFLLNLRIADLGEGKRGLGHKWPTPCEIWIPIINGLCARTMGELHVKYERNWSIPMICRASTSW